MGADKLYQPGQKANHARGEAQNLCGLPDADVGETFALNLSGPNKFYFFLVATPGT